MIQIQAPQGSICVAGLHVVVLFPAKLCVGLLLVHGSLLLGYQPITNHNTAGGEIGSTNWRPATHRDPCDSSYFEGISKWRILSTLHIHWISIISLLSIYGDMENIISLDWARLSVLWTVITSTPCPLCVRAPARAQPCALYREPQYFYSKSEKLKGLTQ